MGYIFLGLKCWDFLFATFPKICLILTSPWKILNKFTEPNFETKYKMKVAKLKNIPAINKQTNKQKKPKKNLIKNSHDLQFKPVIWQFQT